MCKILRSVSLEFASPTQKDDCFKWRETNNKQTTNKSGKKGGDGLSYGKAKEWKYNAIDRLEFTVFDCLSLIGWRTHSMMQAMVLVMKATLVVAPWAEAQVFGVQIVNRTKKTVLENNKVYQRNNPKIYILSLPALEKLCLRTFRDWYIKATMDHWPKFVNFHSPFDRV